MVDLSIVVLGYKAHDILKQFIDQIQHELRVGVSQATYEIILVVNYDDISDPTLEIALDLELSYDNISSLSLKKRGGMGWDMRKGMEAAKGNYICVIDGDGQMPASDIRVVYNIIKSGNFDLVKTYRMYRYDGWIRKVISSCYNLLFRILYQPSFKVRDINSKPKIISREAYSRMNLVSNDWFTDAEIMIQAFELHLRICEVATVFYKNERRGSFVGLRTIFEFVYNLFHYRFSKAIKR